MSFKKNIDNFMKKYKIFEFKINIDNNNKLKIALNNNDKERFIKICNKRKYNN